MTGGVFGAVAKCIKNLDTGADPPLVAKVMEELRKVDGEHVCLFISIYLWHRGSRASYLRLSTWNLLSARHFPLSPSRPPPFFFERKSIFQID